MSNEASRDLGGRGPSPSQSSSAERGNVVTDRQTTPEALEEEIIDGSRSATPIPPEAGNGDGDADGVATWGSLRESRSRSRRGTRITAAARRAVIAQTKIKFLTDFIRSMDMVVYFYFSYMYFLDNSFFRFFIRCAIQLNFLTPKPINLPTPPQRRSVVIGLFGCTIINLLIHILASAPEAGEASGGWLHGGLIIDFIGQEGPISKVRLAITDVTILLLQLVMLAAAIAKLGLLEGVTEGRRRGGDTGEEGRAHDLDSEERGERRGERGGEEEEESGWEDEVEDGDVDGLEHSSGRGGELDGTPQRRRHHRWRRRRRRWSPGGEDENGSLFSNSRQRRSTSTARSGGTGTGGEHEPGGSGDDDGGRYAQYSGQLVVAELSIVDAVRWQWNHGSPGSVVGGGEGSSSTTGASPGRFRAATGASGGGAGGGGEGAAIRGVDGLNQLSRLRV